VLQSGPASLGTTPRTGHPEAALVGGLVHIGACDVPVGTSHALRDSDID
jgi:hypothetical protein